MCSFECIELVLALSKKQAFVTQLGKSKDDETDQSFVDNEIL